MEVTEIFFWIIFSIVGLLIVVNYLRDINEYSPIIADFFKLLEDHNDFKNNMTTYGILYILLIFGVIAGIPAIVSEYFTPSIVI